MKNGFLTEEGDTEDGDVPILVSVCHASDVLSSYVVAQKGVHPYAVKECRKTSAS